MAFFRTFEHLLPDAKAWRVTIQKRLRQLFVGLAGSFDAVVNFTDAVFLDVFPATARTEASGGSNALAEWEKQFGLTPDPDEAVRRQRLAAEWAATGGQSPAYIQGVLQTAGFPVYVHNFWSSGPPYVVRNPHDYTELPLIGTWRCSSYPSQPRCSAFSSQPRCNAFLNNDPGYLVNKDLTRRAPPPIPDDPDFWPYFFYVGGLTFPDYVELPESSRDAFEALLLKLRPLNLWAVTRILYTDGDDVLLTTEDDDPITSEDDDPLIE